MSASCLPPPASFEALLAWYTRLATTPGWWAYAQDRVRTLDADPTGRYRGLHFQVRAQVKALGYRPAPGELGRWWECPSQAALEPSPQPTSHYRRGWVH